jgi:hypothetical protein
MRDCGKAASWRHLRFSGRLAVGMVVGLVVRASVVVALVALTG